MSTGAILTVLSNIPWSQVVDNAPKVAEGAARLWGAVTGLRKSGAPGAPEAAIGDPVSSTGPAEVELLRGRIQSLEESVKTLQDQLQASTELIKALADQNAQLVTTIELHRARVQRASLVGAVIAGLLLAAIGYLAWRP